MKKDKKEFDFREITDIKKAFKKLKMKPDEVPDVSKVPERFKAPIIGFYNLMIATEAINNGFEADYNNTDQKKWGSWFDLSSGGVRFVVSDYDFTLAASAFGPRLSSETKEQNEFIAKNFIKDFELILKK